MAVVSKSDPMMEPRQAGRPEIDSPRADPLGLDAMRSWLVGGVHFVDPRRRFGSHGRARELLVADGQAGQTASRRWQGLASALHRHTVRGGLSELRPDERHVLTLAYLEGRTNREIATLLGVSVKTVQRRLLFALGRLEAYIARSGVWLSALILVALAYTTRPVTHAVRLVNAASASPDRVQRVAATLTAGAMSAAVLGIVAFTSDSGMAGKASRTTTAPAVTQTNLAAPLILPVGWQLAPPESAPPANLVAAIAPAPSESDTETSTPSAPAHHHGKGCGRHSIPAGPRAGQPTGPPRGCGAKD